MELYKLTGGELHRLMKEKKVSAVEVTEDTFARIAKVENGIGAFITATPEEAMKTAQAVDKKIAAGEELHPWPVFPSALRITSAPRISRRPAPAKCWRILCRPMMRRSSPS